MASGRDQRADDHRLLEARKSAAFFAPVLSQAGATTGADPDKAGGGCEQRPKLCIRLRPPATRNPRRKNGTKVEVEHRQARASIDLDRLQLFAAQARAGHIAPLAGAARVATVPSASARCQDSAARRSQWEPRRETRRYRRSPPGRRDVDGSRTSIRGRPKFMSSPTWLSHRTCQQGRRRTDRNARTSVASKWTRKENG